VRAAVMRWSLFNLPHSLTTLLFFSLPGIFDSFVCIDHDHVVLSGVCILPNHISNWNWHKKCRYVKHQVSSNHLCPLKFLSQHA